MARRKNRKYNPNNRNSNAMNSHPIDVTPLNKLFAEMESHVHNNNSGILSIASDEMEFVIDIFKDEAGLVSWGHDPGHKALMIAKLIHPGIYGMTLRTFLPLFYDGINKEGETMRFPYKEVRGYVLFSDGGFNYHQLTASETKECHSFDAMTGRPIEPEVGVLYR